MAYPALLSLSQILDQFLVHDQYFHPHEKQQLISLQGNVTSMLTFLKDCSQSNEINLYESHIIDTSYQLENIIEPKLSSIYLSLNNNKAHSFQTISSKFKTRRMCLRKTLRGVKFVLKKVIHTSGTRRREYSRGPNKEENSTCNFSENFQSLAMNLCKFIFHIRSVANPVQPKVAKVVNNGPQESEGTNIKVGFDNGYVAIKDRMYQNSSEFKIIPIVGMGGIGKSTLARRLFEDSIQMQYFDRHVWVVVSQEYSYEEILLGVLQSIRKTDDELSKHGVAKLIELIHKELYGRRYIFVLDDVWSEKAWDDLTRIMPKNTDGSCVLLTTRLSNVAFYVTLTPVHEMRLLSKDESWILLKKSVFGTSSIPSELEMIGKEIAKKCWGLPLTVVVVAGLLKGNMAIEYWESISHNISSREPTIEMCCSKVLSLSYDHLPIHLKPCFLYVTTFPEDFEINANRLIRLWMAEGFVKSSGSKCLEEVAEKYLDDLVGRSILQASRRRNNGRIKTVGIHDLLRDVGIVKAREERFYYHSHLETFGTHDLLGDENILKIQAESNRRDEDILKVQAESNCRRLSIHTEKSLDCLWHIRNPTTRSLLILLSKGDRSCARISNFTMLRVLDAPNTEVRINPRRVVNSRYLAFKIYRNNVLTSWFKLPNLQTLVIRGNYRMLPLVLIVPLEIWTIPSLRHLILPDISYLEQPKLNLDAVKETNLVTLSVTDNLEMNKHTTKMLGNLKKLGLTYSRLVRNKDCSQLSNIVHLEKLEELKIRFPPDELVFPLTLKKLSLRDTECSWREMSLIGFLPNLEVLKLRDVDFIDREWNPVDGQFLKLKYLELVRVPLSHLGAESCHFPSLESLFLNYSHWIIEQLEEIPRGLGDIDTLRLIQLDSCYQQLVDSALQIQADRRDMGIDDLQVIVLESTRL